jgi:hypothetical protein
LLKVWNELNRIGRTGFLTHSTIDATRKVDSEKLRIAALVSVWIVCGLKRNTIDRTSCRAEVARNAALFSVRVSGEHDSPTPAWRQIGSLLRILNRDRLREGPFEDDP